MKGPAQNAPDGGEIARLTFSKRIYLTYQYHGLGSLILRAITFPLRFTPLERFVRFGRMPKGGPAKVLRRAAVAWYRWKWRPVTIVIPSYRDAERVAALVGEPPRDHQPEARPDRRRRRRQRPGARRRAAADPRHRGDRGRDATPALPPTSTAGCARRHPTDDVVILNSDMIARPGWLASLQFAASPSQEIGIVGAKLLYPDDRIQFGGTVRNLGAPEWFDHRYRFKRSDWGPANVMQPVLAVTGACMYITARGARRDRAFRRVAIRWPTRTSTTAFARGRPGYRVVYCPAARALPPRVGHPRERGRASASAPRSRRSGSGGASSSTRAMSATPTGLCGSST